MIDENSLIGKQFGRYVITEELSLSGGFSIVYKGKHPYLDEIVAIKILRPHYSSKEDLENFIREAQRQRELEHAFILPIIDVGIESGVPYIVTEYASLGSLRDRLNEQYGQPLALKEALTILNQIGQALHHAHQKSIMHRDLKPENIFFNVKGEALLADFGIAVIAKETSHVSKVVGTLAYMAPEQLNGVLSQKSDQYALGCIAYELLTGRPAFIVNKNSEWYVIANKIFSEYPPAPRLLNPHLPEHVEQAILRAMEKQYTARHADVLAFIEALQPLVQSPLPLEPATKPLQPLPPTNPLPLPPTVQLYEEATFYESKHYEMARDIYKKIIELDPEDAAAYYHEGNMSYKLKQYEEALKAYNHALRLNPLRAIVYYNKGNVLYHQKRYKDALEAYEQAVRVDPTFAGAYLNKGIILSDLEQYEEALASYNHVLQLKHMDESIDLVEASVYRYKGNALYSLKRYNEALTAYEEAIELDKTSASTYYNRGVVLSELTRYKQALANFEQAIRLNPTHVHAHHNKGNMLYNLHRYNEALEAYEQTLRLNPNYAKAYHSKGNALTQLGRSEEARQAYAKARQPGYNG